MRCLVALLALAGTAAAAPAVTAVSPLAHTSESPMLGVMADVGLPDGATASVVVRPLRPLRLELGAAHDGVGPGVRAGVTWIPLRSWITPTLGVSVGRFFERDANKLARTLSGDATFSSPLLDKVGYDFASARVGLELGRRHVTFFIHAGVSLVTGTVHNVDMAAQGDMSSGATSTVTVSTTDPHVRLLSVSANLGFIVYLF